MLKLIGCVLVFVCGCSASSQQKLQDATDKAHEAVNQYCDVRAKALADLQSSAGAAGSATVANPAGAGGAATSAAGL